MADPADPVLHIVLKEYELVSEEIRARFDVFYRVVGFCLAILGLGFTISASERIPLLILLLPIALFSISFAALYVLNQIMSLGGYKRYLEEQIDELAGRQILLGEKVTEQFTHWHITIVTLGILTLLALFVSAVASLYVSLQLPGILLKVLVFCGLSGSLVLLSGVLFFSIRKLRKVYKETYDFAASQRSSPSHAGSSAVSP